MYVQCMVLCIYVTYSLLHPAAINVKTAFGNSLYVYIH